MEPHFGNWLRRIRNKLGVSQEAFAAALGLEHYVSLGQIEKKPERRLRGDTLEALLDLLGYPDEAAIDAAWKSNALPDLDRVRARLGEARQLLADAPDRQVDILQQILARLQRIEQALAHARKASGATKRKRSRK